MSSSVDLPSIHTTFPSFSPSSTANNSSSPHPNNTTSSAPTSSSASTTIYSPRPSYRTSPSSSPSSPSPVMTFPTRSYSSHSLTSRLSSSSLHSQYSSASDRSLSCSPGPATPCDLVSRSPSFSAHAQERILPKPASMTLPSPQLSSSKRYSSQLSHHQQQLYQQQQQTSTTVSHPGRQQYHGSSALPSPREFYSPLTPSRDHGDFHYSHHASRERSPYGPHCNSSNAGPVDYFHSRPSTPSYHHQSHHQHHQHHSHHLPTPTTPTAMEHHPSRMHTHSPPPLPPQHSQSHPYVRSLYSSPVPGSTATGRRSMAMEEDYPPLSVNTRMLSRSPSISSERSVFSRESSPPYPLSPASTSMSSLLTSLSYNNSSSSSLSSAASSTSSSSAAMVSPTAPISAPGPAIAGSPVSPSGNSSTPSTQPQLLLCPVCRRAFKPSKNQNCNLRRHLKNVHNMSPTMHPRKCKWDSLPDGRVKDDKDRKERTRKSKRLWARKFRLRRKVEEAAVVLSMLSQAV